NTQTAEIAHLENPALALVRFSQALQTEIQRYNPIDLLGRKHDGRVQWNMRCAPTSFYAAPFARVVDQDMPHHLAGDGKEMRSIPPNNTRTGEQPDKCLLHQGRRLHRMVLMLAPEMPPGETVQLGSDQR